MSTAAKRRRGPEPDDFGPPTKTDQARLRRDAAANDKMLDDIYEAGLTEGRRTAKANTPKKRPSSTRKGGKTRRSSRRRSRRRVNHSLKTGAKAVVGPAAADVGSGMQVVGATFALLLLYLTLTNSDAVTGVFGALRRGLLWLSSPDTSIPFRNT